jgi:membrane associated rhomboid family serine protease
MNVLTSSLDGSLFGTPEHHASPGEEPQRPSADAARAAHDDAVRLARDGMNRALWGLIPAAALLMLSFTFSYGLFLLVPAALLSTWAASAAYAWSRLSTADPLEEWERRYQEQVDEDFSIRDAQRRMHTTSGIATGSLAAVIVAVTAVQFLVPGIAKSVDLAALVKPAVRGGEWWRLLSAAYLHGFLLHIVGNVLALLVLGRLVEAYGRPNRVALAFLGGAIGCSLASTAFLPYPSLGASGGVIGLLGYVLAVAVGAGRSAVWLRNRLLGELLLIAASGLILFFRIDNAGHAGGLAAGYLVGAIARRFDARATGGWSRTVDACGYAAAVTLVAGAAFTIGRLVQVW